MKRLVLAGTRLTPQPIIDFLYKRRFSPLLRWGRSLVTRSLGDPADGVPVTRGPLTGFRLAHRDSFAMWVGGHEPAVATEIAKHLRPGAVAFDVGAHVGYTALLLARSVGPTGRVLAFEPGPDSYRLLLRNIELNDLGSYVTAKAMALGNKPGTGSIKPGYLEAANQVLPGTDGDVKISTLDIEVFEGQAPVPDLIVVDTEGAEADVFQGAWRLLQEHSPVIVAEHHGLSQVLSQMLSELGYASTDIDDSHQLFKKTH
ncbi:MAG: FkbM family methyltransferase [Actinomycetota bacterium]|nr:FkbM family methyltransferase [Actinomycetota bacterium]